MASLLPLKAKPFDEVVTAGVVFVAFPNEKPKEAVGTLPKDNSGTADEFAPKDEVPLNKNPLVGTEVTAGIEVLPKPNPDDDEITGAVKGGAMPKLNPDDAIVVAGAAEG